MKNNSIFLALLGVSALLFVGCMKEEAINEQYRPAGSEIVIGASTDYDNGEATRTEYDSVEPGTRTEYSGVIFDVYGSTPKSERINWLSGDNMKIFYQQGTAAATSGVYGVTTINPDREKSYADVVCTDGTKLTWGEGTGTHKFYAMYPAKGFGGNNDMDLTNTNHVTGFIPATQDIDATNTNTVDGQLKYQPDMKYAYMVSYKEIAASSTATRAELPFSPAVTTFEFKFKLNQDDAKATRTVTKFTMEASTNLTGNFALDITGWDNNKATWNNLTQTNNGKKITVNFPNGGYTMTKTAYLDFSVLALPVQQENVTITFYFKESDGTEYHKSLLIKKNSNPVTFAAAKKHIITNDALTGEIITYTLEVTPNLNAGFRGLSTSYNVTSYKSIGTKKVPVEWEVCGYTYAVGSDEIISHVVVDESNWNNPKPVWLPTFTESATNSTAAATAYNVVIAPSDRRSTAVDALTNASEKGTQSNPWDLSMHDINGNGISKTTANCYVITSPGWYKFPLAYGNGYKGGTANTLAYHPSATSSYTLNTFKNHSDSDISSPDIASVSSVELLWQDAQDLITVDDIRLENGYVVFHMEKDNICEGNAVIAAKDSNGTILWSWHIWATPYVSSNVSMRGKTYMARNLGWCDGGTTLWYARKVWVKFRQPENPTVTKILKIHQDGNSTTVLGSGPHYQWGRKDPMLPPIGISSGPGGFARNKIWYNAEGVASQVWFITESPEGGRPRSIGYAIQHPMEMLWLDRANLPNLPGTSWMYFDWTGDIGNYPYPTPYATSGWTDANMLAAYERGHYCNLWNYNNTTTGHGNTVPDRGYGVYVYRNLTHGKTIYDPCPIGYTVPLPTEISNLAQGTNVYFGNGYGTGDANYRAYAAYSGSQTITWDASQYGYVCNGNLLPANGMRFYTAADQHVGNVGTNGYYFSSAPYNQHLGLQLILDSSSIKMDGSWAKGSGRSIRCVPE